MQGYTLIAPIGDNPHALFVGIRSFPTERVILLTRKASEAQEIARDLERFKLPTTIVPIGRNIWDEVFHAIARIKNQSPNQQLIINVSTGDNMMSCAATSAAFVNGIKAYGIEKDQPMLLPVLKFSYYKLITEKKLKLLNLLHHREKLTIQELSTQTKMSLPLISYHINGNATTEGLLRMGLVATQEDRGKTIITLTSLGTLLIRGYIT
ncbi:ArsR family transcriptional regulator [Candidatus Woesearchaeota archaeon]|nr:ArsR family transcriptional regulator [Candidatus Woesearchaeota archaeon]